MFVPRSLILNLSSYIVTRNPGILISYYYHDLFLFYGSLGFAALVNPYSRWPYGEESRNALTGNGIKHIRCLESWQIPQEIQNSQL